MVTAAIAVHPEKADLPIEVVLSGMVNDVREEHPLNTPSPIVCVFEVGAHVTVLRDVQPAKIESPRFWTLGEIVASVREVHPENAEAPSVLTLDPISMVVMDVPWKALAPMVSTESGRSTDASFVPENAFALMVTRELGRLIVVRPEPENALTPIDVRCLAPDRLTLVRLVLSLKASADIDTTL